jgi:protein gp37
VNKQLKIKNRQLVSRGIEWAGSSLDQPMPGIATIPYQLPDGRTVHLVDNGRTSNPIGGCHFGCRWLMPDGTEAICYAERVAEGVARGAFEDGFAPTKTTHGHTERQVYWRPGEFEAWSKAEPCEIFAGSMADMAGPWVPDEMVQQVIDAMRRASQHRFYVLTKNAPRLPRFEFPENVWVGASVPPSKMGGVTLDADAQRRMLHRTIASLYEAKAGVRWLSLEPLSWDAADVLSEYDGLNQAVQWIVIGAATNGATAYQPDVRWVNRLLILADEQQIPVFFKGNMAWDRSRWREDKPVDAFWHALMGRAHGDPQQLDMFGGAQ